MAPTQPCEEYVTAASVAAAAAVVAAAGGAGAGAAAAAAVAAAGAGAGAVAAAAAAVALAAASQKGQDAAVRAMNLLTTSSDCRRLRVKTLEAAVKAALEDNNTTRGALTAAAARMHAAEDAVDEARAALKAGAYTRPLLSST